MCINQLLRNEQITLMRYATATDPVMIDAHKRKLSIFERLLEAHPYPHRAYESRVVAPSQLKPNRLDMSASGIAEGVR